MAEQIKKSDVVQGEPFNELAKEMQSAILVLEKFDAGVKSVAKSLDLVSKESKTTVQGINNITQAEKESQKLVQQKVANDKALEKMRLEEIRLNKAREKSIDDYNKKAAKEQKQALDSANAYKQLERATRDQKNESKRLGAELLKLEADGKKNTKAFRDLEKQYRDTTAAAQKGDAQLKKLDKTVGDNFRNVGGYSNAIGGLKNALGQLGLAVGVGAAVRNVFGVIKDFDQGVANLASVLGKTRGEIVALEEDAKRLGSATSFTASQVAQLQTEYAKLGFTETEILAATEATLALAAATGTELGRAAEVAGSTVRAFGLNADETMRITDVMAKSFSTSALDMEKFAESMKYVAPVSKAAGLSVEETTAMLGALANAGISGSQAGTALRQVISEMDKTGKSTGEALADLAEKGLSLADAEDEVGKNAKTALLVLADQTKTIDDLTKTYNNAEGSAQQMADTQLNTLGGAITLLESAWEGFILQMNDASGSGVGLTEVIKFLANNLETILSVLGKAIKAYILYRTTMMATAVAQRLFATETGKLSFSLSNMVNNLKGGGEGLNKLKGALKGVGITMFIALFAELATEIYRVASGAADAERKIEGMNNAMSLGGKLAGQRVKFLREEVGLGKITEEQAINDMKNQVKILNIRRAKLKVAIEDFKASERYQNAIAKNPLFRTFEEAGIIGTAEGLRNMLYEVDAELTVYNQELKDIAITQYQTAQATEESTKAIKANTKEKKDNNEQTFKAIGLLEREVEARKSLFNPEETERLLLLDEERAVVAANIAVTDAEMALMTAKQLGNRKEILKAEEQLRKARVDAVNAQLKLDLATETDPAKRVLLEKNAQKEIMEINNVIDNSLKERVDMMNNIQQAITYALQEQIDKRISLLQKESDAAKSQQDYLMGLAENGNITAKESIAEQIEIQREAQAEQMRLEKQKQNLELISQGLSTFNAQIAEGKSPGEALASTIVSTQALVGFLKNLNFYAKGTDYAPGGMAVVDEKGAEIITDSQGRIKDIGTGEGARFVNLSKGDKVITASKTAQILNAFGGVANANMIGKGKDSAGNGYDIMKLNNGLNRIEQAIKNKPEYQVHWDTFGTVERVRKGGDVVTNRYRVK